MTGHCHDSCTRWKGISYGSTHTRCHFKINMTFRKIWFVDIFVLAILSVGCYQVFAVISAAKNQSTLVTLSEFNFIPFFFGFWLPVRIYLIVSKHTKTDLFRSKKWNTLLFILILPFIFSHRITSIALGTQLITDGYVKCPFVDRFSRLRTIHYVKQSDHCPTG